MVILPGASRPSGLLRAIDVVFEDFIAGPDAKVVLDGRWIVRVSGQPTVTHHERISIDIASLEKYEWDAQHQRPRDALPWRSFIEASAAQLLDFGDETPLVTSQRGPTE